jgi:hypothetical protein
MKSILQLINALGDLGNSFPSIWCTCREIRRIVVANPFRQFSVYRVGGTNVIQDIYDVSYQVRRFGQYIIEKVMESGRDIQWWIVVIKGKFVAIFSTKSMIVLKQIYVFAIWLQSLAEDEHTTRNMSHLPWEPWRLQECSRKQWVHLCSYSRLPLPMFPPFFDRTS